MLKDMGIYKKITGNAKCKRCWSVESKNWFTSRLDRETPDRIEKGKADEGIVWTTEIIGAKKRGCKVEGVAIPDFLNKGKKAGYAIGALKTGRNQKNTWHYPTFLAKPEAQNIYSNYGFVKASAAENKLKPLP